MQKHLLPVASMKVNSAQQKPLKNRSANKRESHPFVGEWVVENARSYPRVVPCSQQPRSLPRGFSQQPTATAQCLPTSTSTICSGPCLLVSPLVLEGAFCSKQWGEIIYVRGCCIFFFYFKGEYVFCQIFRQIISDCG